MSLRDFVKLSDDFERLEKISDRLHIYHPPFRFLPVGRLPVWLAKICLQINGYILASGLRSALKELGLATVVFLRDPAAIEQESASGEVGLMQKR